MNPTNQALLDELTDRLWLEEGLSRNTLDSYRQDLAQFAAWLENHGDKDLTQVEQADIQGYLAFKFPTSQPRSISRLIASLRRLYRFALRENKIGQDPTLQIDSPKLPRSLPKSLSEEEVEALLKAPDLNQSLGLRDRAMLEILYASGLRVSELVGLKVDRSEPERRRHSSYRQGQQDTLSANGRRSGGVDCALFERRPSRYSAKTLERQPVCDWARQCHDASGILVSD